MTNFINKIVSLVFPANLKCISCNNELHKKTSFNLCKNCFEKIKFIQNPCLVCGENMLNENVVCINCKARSKTYFESCRSYGVYEGIFKSLILKSKFANKKYVINSLVEFLYQTYKLNNFYCDLITFIPSKQTSIKQRGYNLSHELAKGLSKKLNIPFLSTLECNKQSNQLNKNYIDRQKNIVGAFKSLNINLQNKTVLIVDDVYTTGATLNEVSRVLKNNKAKKVYCLTVAHTPKKITYEK